jgi:hypothetical protein
MPSSNFSEKSHRPAQACKTHPRIWIKLRGKTFCGERAQPSLSGQVFPGFAQRRRGYVAFFIDGVWIGLTLLLYLAKTIETRPYQSREKP